MTTPFDRKIPDLPPATLPLSSNDLFAVIQGGLSKWAPISSIGSPSQAATPTFAPAAGTYTLAQLVALASTTPGSSIYYTIDNSMPTILSTLYTTPISVPVSTTVKAFAVASGFTPSAVGSATYVIPNYVGVNGTPVSYFTPEMPFLDIFKQGGNNNAYWGTVVGPGSQTSTNEEAYLQLDSNGYLTSMTALAGHAQTYDRVFTYMNRTPDGLLRPGQTTFYLPGDYIFLFQGAGTMAFTGDVASTSTASPNVTCVGNTITSTQAAGFTASVTVTITTPGSGGIELYVSATDPGVVGNYLKAFSLVHTTLQALYLAGKVFAPTFLTALSGFSVFRQMKWLAVENDDLLLTFTAQLNSGVTSGTLSLISFTGGNYGATWPFITATRNVVFQTGQVIACLLTTGSSAVTWSTPLSANVVTNPQGGAGIMAVVPKTQGWAGRKPFTALGWSNGVPYEVCLQLGNEANIDLWMNLPCAAYYTDTTMGTKLAQLAFNGTGTTMPGFTGLKAAQKVHVEYSNEFWNFIYNCTRFAYSMGAVYIPAQGNASFASQQWMGTQVGLISSQFSAVYGGAFASRVIVSMGTQLAQLSTLLPQAMNAADWVAQGGGHVAPSTQGVGAFHSNPYCPSVFQIKNTDLLAINALADPVSAIFGLLYSNTYGGVTYPSLQSTGLIGALAAYIAGQIAGIVGQPWHTLPHLAYESGDGLSFAGPLNTGDSLVGVVITGTAGQFSCSAGKLLTVNDQIQIAGTYGGTGSITGYANPTTYQISVTNGTTTFTLQTLASAPIVTTAGTPTGLTYTCNLSAAQKTTIGTWLLSLVRDPRMALFFYDPTLTLGGTGYLPAMYALYKFLVHFQFVNPNDTNSTWGLLENINQPVTPLLSAPAKYKGKQNFIAV